MADRKIQTTLVIRGDSRNAVRELNVTEKELEKLIGRQKQGVGVAKQLAAGYGNIIGKLDLYAKIGGTIAVAATGAIVKSQLELIDSIGKTADAIGIQTEALIGYRHAANITGVSNQKLDDSLKKMIKNVGDASNGFGQAKTVLEGLGLANEEFFNLQPAEQFEFLADKISGLETAQKKASAAQAIFGRAGLDLVNTLNLGSDGLAELSRQTEIAGTALSRLEVAKVEQANDAIATAKLQATGFAQQITVQVAPVIKDLADRMFNVAEETDGVGSAAEKSFDFVVKGVGVMADGIHGVRVIVKGLETAFAGVASTAVQGFGLIIEGYTELADLIPGIDIEYGDTAFGRLEESVARNFRVTREELEDLLNEEIPSTALENYIEGVQRKSTESAQAVVDSQLEVIHVSEDLEDQLDDVDDSADDVRETIKKIEREADPLADSYEEALTRIDQSFVALWRSAGDGVDSFVDSAKDTIADFLAEIAHQSTTQPLLLNLGFVGQGGGLTIPGSGGSAGAFSSTPLAGLLGLGGGVPGLANLVSNSSLHAGNALYNLGLDGLGDIAIERSFQATNWSTTDLLKDAGLNAVGGVAGSFVGSELGGALFGKTAESNIGSTVLGAAGSLFGPWGTFIGSAIGSAIDAATGGDGKKDVKAGFLVNPAANTANNFRVDPFASGYAPIGFAERVSTDVANQVIDQFRVADSIFTQLSRSAGLSFNFSGANFNGLDARANPGSSGLFFGLAGENGLGDQDLASQVANFLLQEINAVADQLDPSVLEAVNSAAKDADSILRAYAKALEDVAKETEGAEDAEGDLQGARAEQIDQVRKLASQLASQMQDLDSLGALSISGSYSSELQRISDLRDLYIQEAEEQERLERELHDQRVENYRESIDLARDLGRFTEDLLTGDLSPLKGPEKLGEAKDQFYSLASRAAAGDFEAGSELTGAANTYLRLARDYYASSPEYTAIFEAVQSRLGSVQGVLGSVSDPGAFDGSANEILRQRLQSLEEELQELNQTAQVDIVQQLMSLNLAFSELPEDLASALSGVLDQSLMAAIQAGREVATSGGVGGERTDTSRPVNDFELSGFLTGVLDSGASERDQVSAIVTSAVANNVSSEQLARAYNSYIDPGAGVTAADVNEIAARFGFETFADGGITDRPAIFGEAGLEAAVPLKNGSIPVELRGAGDRQLMQRLGEISATWRGLEGRLENIEHAIRHSSEVISGAVYGNADSVVNAIETESAIKSRAA